MLRKLLIGLYARVVNPWIRVRPRCWVFGADYGRSYRESSKYMLDYMRRHHPDYDCCFVTQSPDVLRQLRAAGIPCVDNLSVEGVHRIARAEAVFTCQAVDDVRLAYRKAGRRYYYLMHGQSFKVAVKSLTKDYLDSVRPDRKHWLKRMQDRIYLYLLQGNEFDDVEFVSATSDFLVPYLHCDFGDTMEVKVLGSPRNDVLLADAADVATPVTDTDRWPDEYGGHRIITYMPTHRKYGQGALSPLPFLHDAAAQQWLRDHGYLLLVKQHPNMIPRMKGLRQTDVIRDITATHIDPQQILRHTDVLITDYSSVWIDYLLLRRPVIFYLYDDFEKDDAGCYFDFRQDFPGHFCHDEAGLLALIQEATQPDSRLLPHDAIVSKYHKYEDSGSCQRFFEAVTNQKPTK